MNALSLEHRSYSDRHGLTYGLTAHHNLKSLFSSDDSLKSRVVPGKKKGYKYAAVFQHSEQSTTHQLQSSNHPNSIHFNQTSNKPPPPPPPNQPLHNAVHHLRLRRFRSSHFRRRCQARTHRSLPGHRHSSVLPSRRRRRS
jgi:hypothetical protein